MRLKDLAFGAGVPRWTIFKRSYGWRACAPGPREFRVGILDRYYDTHQEALDYVLSMICKGWSQ